MSKDVTCIKCGKPAYRVYKPDLDVAGIGMCSEHEEEISLALMIANFEGWDKFEKKYLKNGKNNNKV
jgi:hypothetical protein